MPGPLPASRPFFPADFLEQVRQTCRRRTAPADQRQRARLALLLDQRPELSNVEAGQLVGLHPDSVRLWRRRWAQGVYTLRDQPGRGRKSPFSPAGPGHRHGRRL